MSTWLLNAWYVAASSTDIQTDELVHRVILGNPIILFRDAEGGARALEDRCPHRGAPLSLGKIVDGLRVRCGYHGLEFDIGGHCINNPHGAGKIPSGCRVRVYSLIERYGMVWVWTGVGTPDASRLPRIPELEPDDLSTLSKVDCVRMAVPFDYILDNVMDLSHAPFLHDGILGNSSTIAAETEVIQEGDTVTVKRFMQNVPPPEYHDLTFLQNGEPVDVWHDIRWQPPCNLLLDVGATLPHASRDEGARNYAGHFLTPETETSTLYHFVAVRVTPVRGIQRSEAEVASRLAELRRLAFAGQDEPMIRAQYENIMRTGGEMNPQLLSIDAGAVRWRRVMAQLLQNENTSGMLQNEARAGTGRVENV